LRFRLIYWATVSRQLSLDRGHRRAGVSKTTPRVGLADHCHSIEHTLGTGKIAHFKVSKSRAASASRASRLPVRG